MQASAIHTMSILHARIGICVSGTLLGVWSGLPLVIKRSVISWRFVSQRMGSPNSITASIWGKYSSSSSAFQRQEIITVAIIRLLLTNLHYIIETICRSVTVKDPLNNYWFLTKACSLLLIANNKTSLRFCSKKRATSRTPKLAGEIM